MVVAQNDASNNAGWRRRLVCAMDLFRQTSSRVASMLPGWLVLVIEWLPYRLFFVDFRL